MTKIPPKPNDKRTKRYKEWVAKYEKQSDGVGDTVEKITKATGIKAAVDAREEGTDILIMARTDANHTHGLKEAIERANRFHAIFDRKQFVFLRSRHLGK